MYKKKKKERKKEKGIEVSSMRRSMIYVATLYDMTDDSRRGGKEGGEIEEKVKNLTNYARKKKEGTKREE